MSDFPINIRVKLTYNLSEVMVMAEFCVSCWNKINGTDYPEEAYALSWDYELCEGCGEYRRVIVAQRKHYLLRFAIRKLFYRKKNR